MSSSAIVPKGEIRKALIVRLGALGDVVHALPAASLLRREAPAAEIHWLVDPRWAPLLAGSPAIDKVITLPLKAWQGSPLSARRARAVWDVVRGLRGERYDLALDLQGLLKSAVAARAAGARRVVGFDRSEAREGAATIFYSQALRTGRTHVVDRYAELARLAVGGSPRALEAPLPRGEESEQLPQGEFVLASPLAGWKSKQWPAERYAELANMLWRERGMQLVLDCAPADAAYCRRIAALASDGSCVVQASTIAQLIGATRRATAVVGVDSGPLHLAAALAKSGVALFGPTDPARNGPYAGGFTVLRAPGAKTSYRRADEYSESMRALSVETVWASLGHLIPAPQRSTVDVGD